MELTLQKAEEIMNASGGSLYLSNTPITSLPDNLTVGGSLYLSNTPITSLPDNLTVGGWLYLSNTPIASLPDNLTVGGSLDLRDTQITSLPDNLTVGGWLDLSGTPITSLPDNLTAGGWLDLSGTPITSLPDNLTVGGSLYLSGTQIADPERERSKVKKLQHGEYAEGEYLYADGILTHVKRVKRQAGYTFYIGKIKGKNVVSDGAHYAHCDSFRDGIADLLFKAAEDRGAEQYKEMSLGTSMTVPELAVMYRIITGACQQGTQHFINSLGELKERYTIEEVNEMTKGQYGHEQFAKFFGCEE